jgi:hypothetical protein
VAGHFGLGEINWVKRERLEARRVVDTPGVHGGEVAVECGWRAIGLPTAIQGHGRSQQRSGNTAAGQEAETAITGAAILVCRRFAVVGSRIRAAGILRWAALVGPGGGLPTARDECQEQSHGNQI